MRIRSTAFLILVLLLALLAPGCGDDPSGDAGKGSGEARSEADSGGGEDDDPPASDPGDAGSEPATFVIEVRDGQVVGGPQPMPVARGDRVSIEILADEAGDVHLHGIDQEAKVVPGTPTVLEFAAKDQGSYELELHDSGLVLGSVQVS